MQQKMLQILQVWRPNHYTTEAEAPTFYIVMLQWFVMLSDRRHFNKVKSSPLEESA